MTSTRSWFAMFWVFSTGFSLGSRRENHPLCRALEHRDKHQPTDFPLKYTCIGDGADAMCTPWNPNSSDAGAEKEGTPAAVTWLVHGGRDGRGSNPAEDRRADEWVYCTDYYARSTPLPDPDKYTDAPSRRSYAQMMTTYTATEGVSLHPKANTDGTQPSRTVSQEFRALRKQDTPGTARFKIIATHISEDKPPTNASQRGNSLVYAPSAICDDLWLTWPAVQERAIADGTVLIFDVIKSVGNLFLAFNTMIQFVRLLEVGLILRWNQFPGFGEAFIPGDINWDLDADPFLQDNGNFEGGDDDKPAGLHSMEFYNFAMVLSDSQLELLASTLGITETNKTALAEHFQNELPDRFTAFMSTVMRRPLNGNKTLQAQPCTWNMLLRRSSSMMASLEHHSPWRMMTGARGLRHQSVEYIAWHIRTPDGETALSYDPDVHTYIIQEPSSDVCPTYVAATEEALQLTKGCHASLPSRFANELVYISSNSKSMAKDCALEAASNDMVMGHVDMGLNSSDAHTAHSQNPLQTALGAFLDFLFLMDSTVIVRTASSFSGTVVSIKGLNCHRKVYDSLPNRALFVCLPSDC